MKQNLYSDITNWMGSTKLVLCTLWQDTLLLGTGKPGSCINTKRWVRVGETIEIDGKNWRLAAVNRCAWGVSAQLQLV